MTLSDELFYPDCPNGHSGLIHVRKRQGDPLHGEYRCVKCDTLFDEPDTEQRVRRRKQHAKDIADAKVGDDG